MSRHALLTALLLCIFLGAGHASKDAFYRSAEYNAGDYGRFVVQEFKSTTIRAAQPNFMKPFSNCDDGSKLFLAPRGTVPVVTAGPAIYDLNGDFIWASQQHYGQVYNFQVQHYRGEPYLTFWAGNDAVDGHGAGHYYMLDKHYDRYKRISAANNLSADLHSFAITDDGTALFSIYNNKSVDLTGVHSTIRDGYIWDGVFQEIDIETDEVLFEWHASDHFSLKDAYIGAGGTVGSYKKPWDWFHINMIEKDAEGNYLVSSRHLRTIFYVDGKSGDVRWQLGGKRNSFFDLDGGDATTFVGQHDAHWADDHKAITFFDNRADWQDTIDTHSRGTRVAVDLEKMTAKLDMAYINPNKILSISQGSYQTLPNGNVLIGYGYNGIVSEFAPNGTLLCDAWFLPQTRFGTGDVQSYRDLKFKWTGLPKTPLSIVFQDDHFYVSWLGATEVRQWVLYDSHTDEGEFNTVLSFPKHGFETGYLLNVDQPIRQYVRVVALDRDGHELGTSLTVDMGNKTTVFEDEASDGEPEEPEEDESETMELDRELKDVQLLAALAVFAFLSSLLVAWMVFSRRVSPPQPYHMHYRTESKSAQYGELLGPKSRTGSGALPRIRSLLRTAFTWRRNMGESQDRANAHGSDESLLSRNSAA